MEMEKIASISDTGIIILILILLAIELGIINIPNTYIIILLVITGILQVVSMVSNSKKEGRLYKDIDDLKNNINSLNKNYKKSEVEREKATNFFEKQVNNFTDFKKETKEREKILNNWVGRGLITNDDILNSMEDADVYFLYCYANKPVSSKLLPAREYPKELAKMGFIRLPVNQSIFITTSYLINKEYRNLHALKKFVTEIVRKSL